MFYTKVMEIEKQKIIELLNQSPLFAHLKEIELIWLAGFFQPTVFRAGEVIFNSGDSSDMMYLVLEGQVDLISENGIVLSPMKIGDIFGEEALLYDDPRFYRAVAQTNSILLQLIVDQYNYRCVWICPGCKRMSMFMSSLVGTQQFFGRS